MNGFDRQRALSALMLLVMALFVSGGAARNVKWRRRLTQAAILGFAIGLAAALAEAAVWLAGR